MAEARRPQAVNLICAVLAGRREWLAEARTRLEGAFGPVDLESEVWPFDFTDYYERDMGPGLLRQIHSFRDMIEPDGLAQVKNATNRLEAELAGTVADAPARPVNLDPGYVNSAKLVLATTKDFAHRVCVGCGIYAESTLRWQAGRFVPWEWTYPDYRTEHYGAFFARVRALYIQKLRSQAST